MAPGDVLNVGRELVVWKQAATSTARPMAVSARSGGASTGPDVASVAITPARTDAVATRMPAASFDNSQIRQVTYIVRRGDSLYSIARRFRVTIPNLLQWNDMNKDKYLQPGQRLVMFVNVLEQSG
jgi:membrane-bound lytic murein transglycosylase D